MKTFLRLIIFVLLIGGWALAASSTAVPPPQASTFAAFDVDGHVVPYANYTTYTTADDAANVMLAAATFTNKNVRIVGSSHAPISVQVDTANAGSTSDVNTVSLPRPKVPLLKRDKPKLQTHEPGATLPSTTGDIPRAVPRDNKKPPS